MERRRLPQALHLFAFFFHLDTVSSYVIYVDPQLVVPLLKLKSSLPHFSVFRFEAALPNSSAARHPSVTLVSVTLLGEPWNHLRSPGEPRLLPTGHRHPCGPGPSFSSRDGTGLCKMRLGYLPLATRACSKSNFPWPDSERLLEEGVSGRNLQGLWKDASSELRRDRPKSRAAARQAAWSRQAGAGSGVPWVRRRGCWAAAPPNRGPSAG